MVSEELESGFDIGRNLSACEYENLEIFIAKVEVVREGYLKEFDLEN